MTSHNTKSTTPNVTMKISLQGLVRLQATEQAVYRSWVYNFD
jgi:hypothetical protein